MSSKVLQLHDEAVTRAVPPGDRARLGGVRHATRVLQAVEEMAGIGHWRQDLRIDALEWSDQMYRIYGYRPRAFRPTVERAAEACHPEDRERARAIVTEAVRERRSWSFEMRLLRADGAVRTVVSNGGPEVDARGDVVGLFGTLQDITRRKERELELKRLADVVALTEHAVVITDPQGRITWTNAAFSRLTGYAPDEVVGKTPGGLLQGPETDPETAAMVSAAIQDDPPRAVSCDILNYARDGRPYWVNLSIIPRLDDDGALLELLAVQVDVTEQREVRQRLERQAADLAREVERRTALEAELRRQALTDELTGAPNRRHFMAQAAQELARAQRYRRPLAVVSFDLDRFKAINDGHGHAAGDAVLRAVAERVMGMLRSGSDLMGRLGGEEFGILLPETDLDGAREIAARMRAAVEALEVRWEGERVAVTCSFGVSEIAADDGGIEPALRRADEALYAAKAAGRNRVATAGVGPT